MTRALAAALGAIGPLESRNIYVLGNRTSMRLEPAFWRALTQVALRESLTETQVIGKVASRSRCAGENLSSAMRSFLLGYVMRSPIGIPAGGGSAHGAAARPSSPAAGRETL